MTYPSESFVSLFSGAGGLDAGLEAAGWRALAQVEIDHDAAETLRLAARRREAKGEPPTSVIEAPVAEVSPSELRQRLGVRRGELGLVAGGPPCQPFTTHGRRRSINDERAASTWPSYLDFVDEFDPRAILIENVDGLLSAALRHRALLERGRNAEPLADDERKGTFLRWLLQELTSRGYTVSWGVAEAADYGAPQFRQRAILLGVQGSEPCYLPPATHGGVGQPDFVNLKQALVGIEALGAIQPLSARKRAVYAQIPPGGNWRDLSEEMQRETMGQAHFATGGKSGWWRRLDWESPSATILGMPDHSSTALVHPDEVRCLSVYECAAIQTFPSDYAFAGSGRSQYQQIGDAVPCVLGQALGNHLRGFLYSASRLPAPPPAEWRKESANRRIGTQGWATYEARDNIKYTMNSRVRPDHIWATLSRE